MSVDVPETGEIRAAPLATISNSAAIEALSARSISRPIRLAVICDFAEENWPSMDLVADMLTASLRNNHRAFVQVEQIRPALPFASDGAPDKFTRLFGRFLQYPRELRKIRRQFDLFHIVDHSYAHLVHSLPPERTVVTCHDLDTFRCLIAPESEPRPALFKVMTRRILSGFQRTAHVACASNATRDEVIAHNLIPEERLSVVHNGVHPAFLAAANPSADAELSQMLQWAPDEVPELLHVGSTVSRKRMDVLLRVFAEVLRHCPSARLVRIGGPFTPEQEVLAASLHIRDHIDVLPRIAPELLSAAYRRATVLLQPSESEGFGLPVIEAMACGIPVIASDIPPLREVGGDAAIFCPVADIPAWRNAVIGLLQRPPDRDRLLAHAQRFTWTQFAASMIQIYNKVQEEVSAR